MVFVFRSGMSRQASQYLPAFFAFQILLLAICGPSGAQELSIDTTNVSSAALEYVRFSTDGKVMATTHFGNVVNVWTLPAARVRTSIVAEHVQIDTMFFMSPLGDRIATESTDGAEVVFYETVEGRKIGEVTLEGTQLRDVIFSKDGTILTVWTDGSTGTAIQLAGDFTEIRRFKLPLKINYGASAGVVLNNAYQMRFDPSWGGLEIADLTSDAIVVNSKAVRITGAVDYQDKVILADQTSNKIWRFDPALGRLEEAATIPVKKDCYLYGLSSTGRYTTYGSGSNCKNDADELTIYDNVHHRVTGVFSGVTGGASFSGDDKAVALVRYGYGPTQCEVTLIDPENGNVRARMPVRDPEQMQGGVALSPTANIAIFGSNEIKSIRIFDINQKKEITIY